MHLDLVQERQSHGHAHSSADESMAGSVTATTCRILASSSSSSSSSSPSSPSSSPSARSILKNPAYYYEPGNIVKVLIPMSILGWLAFGAICILCINGHGRAGRWIPEWYLDSEGTRWDKAAVGAWWLAVMFGWPVILPCTAVGSLSRRFKGWRAERQRRNTERDAGYIA